MLVGEGAASTIIAVPADGESSWIVLGSEHDSLTLSSPSKDEDDDDDDDDEADTTMVEIKNSMGPSPKVKTRLPYRLSVAFNDQL